MRSVGRQALCPEAFERATSIVRERTGLVFSQSRQLILMDACARAMRRTGLVGLDSYLDILAESPRELDDLVAEITVGESYFFRDPSQLQELSTRILPDLAATRPQGHRLRIWSAGCACGEEAATLAIIASADRAGSALRVFGTDICRPALRRAKYARYGTWALRGLTPVSVARYFNQEGGRFRLKKHYRDLIEYSYLNLAEETYPSTAAGIWGMDVILCRNVLIYFDAATAERVLTRLAKSLAPGGWLLLGASDPLPKLPAMLEAVLTSSGLVYQRRSEPSAAPKGSVVVPRVSDASLATRAASLERLGRDGSIRRGRTTGEPVSLDRIGLAAARQAYAEGDYETAAIAAAAGVAEQPGDVEAWVLQVRSLANAGRLEEAERACLAGLERHRPAAGLLCLQAILLSAAGRYAESAAAARAALYTDPQYHGAQVVLGQALARAGMDSGARVALRAAERALMALGPSEVVPGAEGECAGSLLLRVRTHLRLLGRGLP